MSDIENPKVEEATQKETEDTATQNDVSKFESIIEQQNKQIENLLKQVDITTKVNDQLGNKLDETLKNLSSNSGGPVDPNAWIDKELAENFRYKTKYDFDDPATITGKADEIANWYLAILKEKEQDNQKVATRMNGIFEIIEGKRAPINEII